MGISAEWRFQTEGMEIPRGLKCIQCIWKQSKTKNNNSKTVSRRQGGRGVLGKEGDISGGYSDEVVRKRKHY